MAKNRPKLIVLTGTPGTGKTTIAKKLSLLLDYAYLDGSKLAKKASVGRDRQRSAAIVDASLFTKEVLKVRDSALKKGEKGLILDSHISHFLPKSEVSVCIVLTCQLPELYRRLRKRRYSGAKIRENMDAEIFDTILVEAAERKHNTIEFDATKVAVKDIKALAARIRKL